MISIWTMGKSQSGYVADGVADFMKKLERWRRVAWRELPAPAVPAQVTDLLLKKESAVWDKYWPRKGRIYLLHNEGQLLTSEAFADKLFRSLEVYGQCHLLVGGPYGFAPEVRQRAHEVISLSPMIFNHQVVRLMLLEQVYRAFCIRHGVPYHHD